VSDALEQAFLQLRREYVADAPQRLAELAKDAAALRRGEPDAHASLVTRFHRLAGSGGSYGFPAISALARRAEQRLEADEADAEQVDALTAELGRLFDDARRELGLGSETQPTAEFGWRALVQGPAGTSRDWMASALQGVGYSVATADPSDDASQAAIAGPVPDLVVVSAAAGADPYPLAASWTMRSARPRAIVLLTPGREVDELRAAAAGVDATFSVDRIADDLPAFASALARLGAPPAQVLLATADRAGADRICGALEQAKVRAVSCTGAEAVLEAMERQMPDLLLLDLRLPDLDPLLLLRRIRQSPRLGLVPVVALSPAPVPTAERIAALGAGADDLLELPCEPALLLQLAVSRVERGRWVRQLVHRDGLTGLLNHGTFMAELDHAVEYGRRHGEAFALLLVDLDHFRRVNERLGYHAGDQVLAQTAALLRASVRASDLLARYGGEQFALLLRATTRDGAATVAEKLRAGLARTRFETDGATEPLSITGSVSCAAFPEDGATAAALAMTAAEAMRRAKAEGRNRVA
jgi:diguanylate cyclase (GGDEF)-like protein